MKEIGVIFRISLLLMLVCGLGYPLALTGISQAAMPGKSNGSLVYDRQGNVIGSELIGQRFRDPRLFKEGNPASSMMPQDLDPQTKRRQIPIC